MKIIVDAFGGDNAPLEIIKGSCEAKAEYNVDIVFTGNRDIIEKVAKENNIDISGIEIIHTEDVISMHDTGSEIMKSKSNSSMALGLKAVAEGKGDAFVSAGNSGALCVGATLLVKRIKGIKRPGFAPVIPTMEGCLILADGGANVDCRPEMLQQFGIMGSAYMNKVYNLEKPRVALANVGEEECKGGELQLQAYQLMKNSPINFIGNIEGRDIPMGGCDVLVCDGFTGNLILKTYEGVAMALMKKIKGIFTKGIKNKLAAAMVLSDMKEMKKEFDYNEYGGAPILGCSKPVFKAHGSSNAKTFKNAIRLTKQYVEGDVIGAIAKSLESMK